MTSKVLVKMPEVPFSQVNNVKKTSGELVGNSSNTNESRCISQLQENIRFLQTKHQIMLSRLHDEVDILRQKNRELQFQLVFSKIIPSSNTSPTGAEESTEVKPTDTENEIISPRSLDSDTEYYKKRCIQLEKELATTKAALQTSLAKTATLQALLQQNKIQDVPRTQQQCGQAAIMGESITGTEGAYDSGKEASRLQARLEEAERLVKRLRAETDEQRRELQSIKASLSAGGRGNGGRGGSANNRTGPLHQRFPPLQQQQLFWQQQSSQPQRENNDYQAWNRGNRRNNDKLDTGIQGIGVSTGLPDLRGSNPQTSYNNGNGGQNQNQSRRGNHGYNNHYYRNSERGHRGGESRSYREDEHQYKGNNTPAETPEGDAELTGENVRSNTYKNKRGQKYQDKS